MSKSTSVSNGCPYCGERHGVRCPIVKAIEYHPNLGGVKRVEFYAPNEYPQSIGYEIKPSAVWPQISMPCVTT